MLQTNAPSSDLQMQPSERPDYPHAWKPHSNCSSSRACHHHAFCVCPSAAPGCAERPLPATPAVGPLSSESTLTTLRRFRRRLTPAQTAPVCLLCPTSPPMHAYRRPLTAEPTASTQQCLWCRCATLLIRHSIQLDCDAALTWIRAGPRPAAELAHNKTLQSKNRCLPALRKSTRRVTYPQV